MEVRRAVVSFFLRAVLNSLCKIDCHEYVEALAKNKPMIVIFNHINFLEVPILVAFSYPVKVTGLVKEETWKNPIFSFLFNSYHAVPIARKGAFIESFRKVRDSIKNGYHMCIAPEGTRNRSGILGHGKPGVIQLALETDVPILPVAHHGGENVWKNIKSLRRTNFLFKAGRPFKIKINGRLNRINREEIMTEIMRQIALLLPEKMRGDYAANAENECKYLEFV